jgi:2-(1,2-epoxy-1,2-dihydrophenyl)acetyl-CoA isomerase
MTALVVDRPAPGVTRWRLDGPEKLNALDGELRAALVAEIARVADDDQTRVIVLTGTGRAFCAGGDVSAMGVRSPTRTVDLLQLGRRIVEGLATLRIPVIAAVNGLASGAGFNLALAADVIVASPTAWFQQSFTRIGLMPDMGGTYLLTKYIGLGRAKEALLTAHRFTVDEGVDLGFVARRVDDADFDAAVVAYASGYAARAPLAVGMTKWLVNLAADSTLSAALDREALAQAVLGSTGDHAAAVEAFRSKQNLDDIRFEGE